MNILVFTNTFLPIVGGVSESVQRLKRQLQGQGHRVLLVAPRLKGQPEEEEGVIRVAAVQNFNGSDFSWPVPIPGQLYGAIEAFEPDIVHSHHPLSAGRYGLSRRRDLWTAAGVHAPHPLRTPYPLCAGRLTTDEEEIGVQIKWKNE